MDDTLRINIDEYEYDGLVNLDEESLHLSYSLFEEEIPLEVLLDLCSSNKVDIRDIFVSDITSQFLEHIEKMQQEERNYDEIASFLVLAATLIELKSRYLLPRVELDDEMFDSMDIEENLFLRAEEYKMLQDASKELEKAEILHRFYRKPIFTDKDAIISIKDSTVDKMIDAFRRMIESTEYFQIAKDEPKVIEKERYTVENRIKHLAKYASENKNFMFSKLIDDDYSKIERINTFLALLELTKLGMIRITQEQKDIMVKFNNEFTAMDSDILDNIDVYE